MNRLARTLLVALAAAAPAAPAGPGAAPGGWLWDAATDIAAAPGTRGPWQQNDSRYDYVDDATVAFDGAGGLAVAWVDQKRKDVFFRRLDPADGRAAARLLNASRSPGTFSWQPRIAVAKGDPARVYLLWQEIIFSGGSHGGDILFARLDEGGAGFSAPLNLSRSRGGDGKGRLSRTVWSNGSHDLAVAANGDVLAAWTEYHGVLWFARSNDGGASFSAPVRVAGSEARPARAPALAAAPDGSAYLAWTVGEDPAAAIHVARSGDRVNFGPPARVASGPGHADAPRLAVDGKGRVHLVYAEAPAGPRGPYRVRYTRSAGGAAGFTPARTLSAEGAAASAAYPALAIDGRDGVYVSWEVFAPGAGRPTSLQIAASHDGGERFTPPAPVPGSGAGPGATSGSQQGLLGKKLAVDAAGRVAIVNSSLLPGERSRVWLMRGRAAR